MHAIKTFGFASLFAPLFILGCASTNTNNTMVSDTQPNSLSNTNNQETTMSDMPVVQLETSMGDITIELNEEKAPKTVENFLNYVNSGHYEGTIFTTSETFSTNPLVNSEMCTNPSLLAPKSTKQPYSWTRFCRLIFVGG